MCHLKTLTCKGTLRQVFVRLEIQSVKLVFLTQLGEILSLQPSLWFTPHPPYVEVQYMQTL
jgi:hypothetical protein